MLLAFWSPKGGSGTSVLAAACSLVLARDADGARLADLAGDQPAIFALAAEPETGLGDWLAAGPEAPPDALDRLTVAAATWCFAPAARRAAAFARAASGGRSRRGPRCDAPRRCLADRR